MDYGIYPTTVLINDEPVIICPENVRKSLDGTKWICHDPEYAPIGIEPLQVVTLDEAQILMQTSEWSNPDI